MQNALEHAAAAAHRQTERRLKLALSATTDAIWEWNLVTNETYYSSRWYDMLGYADNQFSMTFEAWKELCHPDDFQPTVDRIQAVLTEPDSTGYATEFRMRSASGEWVWILGRGRVVERDNAGKPVLLSGTNTDITERKRREAALAENEQRLRFIGDNLPDGTVLYQVVRENDGTRRFTYVSSGVLAAHGLSPEQVYKDAGCLYGQLHAEDLPRVREAEEASMRKGTLFVCEARIQRSDGQLRWVLMRSAPRPGTHGETIWDGVEVDITDLKHKQEEAAKAALALQSEAAGVALHQSAERLALACRAGGIGIWEYNSVDGTLVWDEQMFALYGVTPEMFTGTYQAWRAGVHPEDLERSERELESALRGEKNFDTEFRVVWPNGSVRHIRAFAKLWRDDSGAVIGLFGTNYDITESKRIQTELAQAKEELEHFFTLSLDMMCIAGVDGYFRRVSPGFDVLGYTKEELTSRPFLDFVHPEDIPATLGELEKLAQGIPTIYFKNRYRCKDGSHRWLEWTGSPDPFGTVYAIARDITQAKQAQLELTRAKEMADVANRELESFSYSVAHDLRAPLRSIDGFSQALLEDYAERLDADGKKYLGFVRESAQHMAQLIDDLLSLSQVTRSDLLRQKVDLSALSRTTIARLERAHPEHRPQVLVRDGLLAEGDPGMLSVVLENLIGNAWKFSRKTHSARIEIGANVRAGKTEYFVRDNGAGFDMAFSNKLFGVFQRLHSAAEFEGTGVGLATVQRVIHRHGGRVWAEAEVNRGATFHFTLYDAELTP